MRAILVSMLLALMSVTAFADPAVVIRADGGCVLFDGDGAIVSGDVFGVLTKSTPQVLIGICSAKGLDNSTGTAVKYDAYNNPVTDITGTPVPCVFDDGSGIRVSFDWRENVSEDGNAKFVCQIKNDV